MVDQETPDQSSGTLRRLWTPWRMDYAGGDARESGCIFCNRIAANSDVESLILHRTAVSIVIMNLYPYNTGHLMVVPDDHIATPEDADPAVLAELATLLSPVLRALRRVLSCHGFNVGFNVGAVAGAGVAEHLHQHIVPRWTGDANFMPILGSTMVIPELIPVTYAKIRAELSRDLTTTAAASTGVLVVDPLRHQVLLSPDGALPVAFATKNQPLWRAAVETVAQLGIRATVAGWSGPNDARETSGTSLTLISTGAASPAGNWIPVDSLDVVDEPVRAIITRGLDQLSPIVRPHIG